MTLIKKGIPLSDPNRESNIKHVTANELSDDKNKRKKKHYRIKSNKTFMKYEQGQYEQIFAKKTDDKGFVG